jgi:hypothetical protein
MAFLSFHEASNLHSTAEWKATYFAVGQERSQTLVAGVGMVPLAEHELLPQDVIATATKMAELGSRPPVTQKFNDVDMVLVPAGCFIMGSVLLTDATPMKSVFNSRFGLTATKCQLPNLNDLGESR